LFEGLASQGIDHGCLIYGWVSSQACAKHLGKFADLREFRNAKLIPPLVAEDRVPGSSLSDLRHPAEMQGRASKQDSTCWEALTVGRCGEAFDPARDRGSAR